MEEGEGEGGGGGGAPPPKISVKHYNAIKAGEWSQGGRLSYWLRAGKLRFSYQL